MKTLFSCLVAVVALSTSAFISTPDTSVPKANRAGAITADYLTQPTAGAFTQYTPPGTPNVSRCLSTSTRHCFYSVSAIGKDSIPNLSSYTQSQIDTYVTNGWLAPGPGSVNNRLYIP